MSKEALTSDERHLTFHGMLRAISEWSEDHIPGSVYWVILMPLMVATWCVWIALLWVCLPYTRFLEWKEHAHD